MYIYLCIYISSSHTEYGLQDSGAPRRHESFTWDLTETEILWLSPIFASQTSQTPMSQVSHTQMSHFSNTWLIHERLHTHTQTWRIDTRLGSLIWLRHRTQNETPHIYIERGSQDSWRETWLTHLRHDSLTQDMPLHIYREYGSQDSWENSHTHTDMTHSRERWLIHCENVVAGTWENPSTHTTWLIRHDSFVWLRHGTQTLLQHTATLRHETHRQRHYTRTGNVIRRIQE